LNQVTHWTVPLDHPAFAGHFEGMPILPGVILLDMAIQIMAEAHQIDPAHYKISSVKFLSPVKPGDALVFEQYLSNKGALNFNIQANDRKIASGSIIPASQV
jgi:3-hydroxyacyl-[acyl-carrier-protein] dehydratase